jgi:predicted TIM-barrel fold metal-dependent hydrolase
MYSGPLIDTDIHHQTRSDADLLPYVPERSREAVVRMMEHSISLEARRAPSTVSGGFSRHDAVAPDGTRPGASYELLRDQCLEPSGTARGLLTHNVGEYGVHLNPYVSTDLCRAANDWNVDTWLDLDDRLYSGIVVSGLLPDEAAAEVRRLAAHPKMSCVLIGGIPLGRPLGDPLYHPIYEAAAETALPIVLHSPTATVQSARAVIGSGSIFSEVHMQHAMAGGQNISSFIVHGVFEKYPQLRLVLNEFGIGWHPPLVWGLDRQYDLLRLESPWVKKRPSEYIHEHVTLSTQPIETTGDGHELAELLSTLDGIEDCLCFSSDYPHYTMDDFEFVARVIPKAWHRKVFFENARDVFGWHDLDDERELVGGARA